MEIKILEKAKLLQKEIKWLEKVSDRIYPEGTMSNEEFEIKYGIYDEVIKLIKLKKKELEEL